MTGDGNPTLARRTVLAGAVGIGATAAGTGVTAAQEERPDFGGWLDGVDGGYRDARGQDRVTVEVGTADGHGTHGVSPAGLWVDPGTTVVWEVQNGSACAETPVLDGADVSLQNAVENPGTTVEHTFEDGGIVTYEFDGRETLDTDGAVAVGDGVATVATQGDEQSLLDRLLVGGVITVAFLTPLAIGLYLVYSHRREPPGVAYGGPEAEEEADEERERSYPVTETAESADPERELSHEEFDPSGTLSLVVLYFLILVFMWVFVYFVEFLGNGPTVIG